MHRTAWPCAALLCTALHCTKLHCAALHCTTLHIFYIHASAAARRAPPVPDASCLTCTCPHDVCCRRPSPKKPCSTITSNVHMCNSEQDVATHTYVTNLLCVRVGALPIGLSRAPFRRMCDGSLYALHQNIVSTTLPGSLTTCVHFVAVSYQSSSAAAAAAVATICGAVQC